MSNPKAPDPKLIDGLARLNALASTPKIETPVAEALPSDGPKEPKPDKAPAFERLQNAPIKKPTKMIVESAKRPPGRPTHKAGDLEFDYVKISPKITRTLKGRMDRAVLDFKSDERFRITTMEDLVSKAIEEYLAAHSSR